MTDSGADSGTTTTTTGRRLDNYSSLENDSNDDSLVQKQPILLKY